MPLRAFSLPQAQCRRRRSQPSSTSSPEAPDLAPSPPAPSTPSSTCSLTPHFLAMHDSLQPCPSLHSHHQHHHHHHHQLHRPQLVPSDSDSRQAPHLSRALPHRRFFTDAAVASPPVMSPSYPVSLGHPFANPSPLSISDSQTGSVSSLTPHSSQLSPSRSHSGSSSPAFSFASMSSGPSSASSASSQNSSRPSLSRTSNSSLSRVGSADSVVGGHAEPIRASHFGLARPLDAVEHFGHIPVHLPIARRITTAALLSPVLSSLSSMLPPILPTPSATAVTPLTPQVSPLEQAHTGFSSSSPTSSSSTVSGDDWCLLLSRYREAKRPS